ncbi:MAG: ATP-dependent DNA helicase [Acidiferrobacterales bacterium]|nr:ATP-dependent DNA helicase [Acidiferrobacterales bacterium]
MRDSTEILGPDGPFSQQYKWFKVRSCQQEMAAEIDAAIDGKSNLIAESGTGTGKTFSYLVPPLAAGKTVVVSTRTKNLQEQLFNKDLPWVCNALRVNPQIRMLKGRSNYFCLYRHDRASRQTDAFEPVKKIDRVYDWVRTERTDGDISEYPGLSTEQRSAITSTAENCIGNQCEYAKECYVNRARNDARNADVLIVNHNLLCLNVFPRNESDFGLLSSKDVVIVDEAHRFPEIAAQALGLTVSTERLQELCRNLEELGKDSTVSWTWIENSVRKILELAEAANEALNGSAGKYSLTEVEGNKKFMACYRKIFEEISYVADNLDPFESPPMAGNTKSQAEVLVEDAIDLFARQSEDNASWCEKTQKGFKLTRIPLEPGSQFGKRLDEFECSWIFTSATLAVGSDFSHFVGRLGLTESESAQWESPFDFGRQALAYFPTNMPLPRNDNFDKTVAALVGELMPITRGRTFVLFTSYQSMRTVRELLEGELDYTLLCQGDDSSANLLERFREDGNAVLLGTSSFWEGVDVKGEALSCVVIVKLPFSPPDAVMEARERHMLSQGRNIFNDWQIPTAVLTMKQGVGRLIRDVQDKGMLVLCDPRITTSSYGSKFLESLPPMQRTDRIAEVRKFFQNEGTGDQLRG